jgi:hypothetical protein
MQVKSTCLKGINGYNNDKLSEGENPSAEDVAFWNRVKDESKRIATWTIDGVGISGRAESKMLDKENDLRKQYAGMAMQALLPVYAGANNKQLRNCAKQAVICADALIAELKA